MKVYINKEQMGILTVEIDYYTKFLVVHQP
jgi:hypothetical protein